MSISNKIKNIQASKSVELSIKVAELKAAGEDIIGLNVGEMPENTPQSIIEATKKSLDRGDTKYSNPEGISPLRKKLAKFYSDEFHVDLDSQNLFIGNGSKHILYNIFQILTNPGDEYIIPIPYWVTIPESVKLAGGIPVFVNTGLKSLDISVIEKSITKQTKGIVINSPNNPSGKIYSKEEIAKLIELTKNHDIYLISDEAYDKFSFDAPYISPLNIADQLEKIIIVKSFSKTFKMTGFRLGFMIANKTLITAAKTLQSHLSGNPSTFTQYGAMEALERAQEILPPLFCALKEKRDISYELFSKLFEIEKPEGGFYLFPSIQKYIDSGKFKNCQEMALYILENAKVAVLPGAVFGCPNYLRICFTEDLEKIKEAFLRMEKVL